MQFNQGTSEEFKKGFGKRQRNKSLAIEERRAHGEIPLNGPWFLSAMRARYAPAILLQERFIMAWNPSSQRNSDEIIADLARDTLARAMRMPPGVERERLLRAIGHEEVQAHLTSWAYSSGLQRLT